MKKFKIFNAIAGLLLSLQIFIFFSLVASSTIVSCANKNATSVLIEADTTTPPESSIEYFEQKTNSVIQEVKKTENLKFIVIALLGLLIEIMVRVTPTNKSISILRTILFLIDKLIPDKNKDHEEKKKLFSNLKTRRNARS
jgi:uncharacterized membrane protein YqjE